MDRGLLGELIAAQVPQLRRFARALTRSADAADDLVQDCLERAWRKAHRWEAGTDLRAWLFTIMHNVFVNSIRRKSLPLDSRDQSEIADPKPFQNGQLDLRDLEAGLAQLPEEQREVLLLVCLEELSYEQVAGILGIPIGTVMSRLHRGRERLRKWLAGEQVPTLRRVK